jgi:hypothetical protein
MLPSRPTARGRAGQLVTIDASRRTARYAFVHELIRTTLVHALSFPRRQRVHLRIADAIERTGPSAERPASVLVHHLDHAGAAADVQRTAAALATAGRDADAAGCVRRDARDLVRSASSSASSASSSGTPAAVSRTSSGNVRPMIAPAVRTLRACSPRRSSRRPTTRCTPSGTSIVPTRRSAFQCPLSSNSSPLRPDAGTPLPRRTGCLPSHGTRPARARGWRRARHRRQHPRHPRLVEPAQRDARRQPLRQQRLERAREGPPDVELDVPIRADEKCASRREMRGQVRQ